MSIPAALRRRIVAWVFGPEAYGRALEPLRQRYPQYQIELQHPGRQGADFLAALLRELQLPSTPLCAFPVRCREMEALIRRGWLRDLCRVFPPRKLARFAPAALDLCMRGTALYGLPEDATPYALMVREPVLARQRFKPPETWVELERQLTWFAARERGPVLRVQEGGPTHLFGFLVALLGSNGVNCALGLDVIVKERERLLETYAWLKRMTEQRLLNYPADLYPERVATLELLRSGKASYALSWPGGLKGWPAAEAREIRAVPFPRGPSCQEQTLAMNGSAWCIPHNTASLDVAYELLEALTDTELAKQFELAGGTTFPAQKQLWTDPEVLAQKPGYREAAVLLRCEHAMAPDFFDPELRQLEASVWQALREGRSGEDWLRLLTAGSHRLALESIAHAVVRQAVAFIEAHLGEIRSVTEVAAAVQRNTDYLNRLFQRELQQSCRTYLARRRIERARELLSDLTLSIKEIAVQVGAGSAASFNHMCQRHWRCSPAQMRKRELARIQGRER